MQIPKDAMLLRIFIGESDRWKRLLPILLIAGRNRG